MIRLVVLLLAVWLMLSSPAHAEPISTAIGLTAIISSLGVSTAVAGAIGGALVSATISIGLSLAANALLQKPNEQAADTPSGGADLSVQYGAAIARSAIMGPGATGGHHVYTNVYGATNDIMQCVFVIGDGRHGKLTRLKYNGKDCTMPAGGLSAAAGNYAIPEFVVFGTPAVTIRYFDGRYDQEADAFLIANSNPPGRWTTEHRGRGVAYLVVHQIYAEGDVGLIGVPQLLIETEGLLLYDPRKDSTNGGSGSHRWGQVDTYEPSANPAVQDYNFRRGVLVNGKRILGMQMSPVNLILQMYFAAANINDEPIPLAEGGTEPRYRCSIAVSDDRAASDVLSSMRASTAGYSLERGGQFGPIPGVPQIPIASLAFTDDDMIVGASARFTKYRSRSELVTATHGQFADPAQFWTPAAFPPRENAADDAAIGERLAKSMDLTQVYSSSQAQRIAESERRRTLQQGQGAATLPAKWIGVQPGDWLPYNSARHGNMNVLVTGTSLDTARQQIAITFERIANSVYSWTTAGELFPPEVGDPGTRGNLIMIAAGMTAIGVNVPGDAGQITPGIQFTWTPIFDPTVDQIDFEIRKLGDTKVLPFTADFPEAGSAVCSGHGIAAATTYEYRHKLFTFPQRDTPWSEWANVISGSQHVVQSALTSMPIDEVSLAMFEAGLEDYVGKQLRAAEDQTNRIHQLIASVAAEQEAQNRLELRMQKEADVRIVGQVSALSGGKTWRGDYSATTLYNANDMVRAASGKLYSTNSRVKGIAPPAAPWTEEATAALVSQEWRTFAGPDGAAAQTSDSIEARFGSATLEQSVAQVIAQWKAFAGPDFATAQSEQTTLAQVGANTASITTNTTAIATVDGKVAGTWQVTLDTNGYISGVKAYNDGAVSIFKIIADHFTVAQPGVGGGAEKAVFNIANVEGVPQIVFHGHMFADGTITANKIIAGAINAIHVGTNTIIAHAANIQNLVVDNIHIRGAAISVPGFAVASSVAFWATEQTILTFNIPFRGVAGSTVVVQVSATGTVSPNGQSAAWRIAVNGSNVALGASNELTNQYAVSLVGAASFTASGGDQSVTVSFLASNTSATVISAMDRANLFGCVYLR